MIHFSEKFSHISSTIINYYVYDSSNCVCLSGWLTERSFYGFGLIWSVRLLILTVFQKYNKIVGLLLHILNCLFFGEIRPYRIWFGMQIIALNSFSSRWMLSGFRKQAGNVCAIMFQEGNEFQFSRSFSGSGIRKTLDSIDIETSNLSDRSWRNKPTCIISKKQF